MRSGDHGMSEPEAAHAGIHDWRQACLVHIRGRLVRFAARLLRGLGVDEADLDGEGAVHQAIAEFIETERRHEAAPSRDEKELSRRLYGVLRMVVLRQNRRSRSIKRGGPGRSGATREGLSSQEADEIGTARLGYRRVEADLDTVMSRDDHPEEVVDAKLDLETLLERLPDTLHRKFERALAR